MYAFIFLKPILITIKMLSIFAKKLSYDIVTSLLFKNNKKVSIFYYVL